MNQEFYISIKAHEQKRLETLKKMAEAVEPVSFLNALLLDDRDDVKPIKSLVSEFTYQGRICKTIDAAACIKNKSSLKIAFLLADNEMTPENQILIQQINLLISKGHEILIYSHFPQHEWTSCMANYFQVHIDNDIGSAVSRHDIAVAGNWSLVPDVLKTNAPLKYMLVQRELYLFEKDENNKDIKDAIGAAFIAPVKVIAASEAACKQVSDLFGRTSIVMFRTGSEDTLCIPEKFSLLRSVKILEREFIRSAQSTIQVAKLYNQL